MKYLEEQRATEQPAAMLRQKAGERGRCKMVSVTLGRRAADARERTPKLPPPRLNLPPPWPPPRCWPGKRMPKSASLPPSIPGGINSSLSGSPPNAPPRGGTPRWKPPPPPPGGWKGVMGSQRAPGGWKPCGEGFIGPGCDGNCEGSIIMPPGIAPPRGWPPPKSEGGRKALGEAASGSRSAEPMDGCVGGRPRKSCEPLPPPWPGLAGMPGGLTCCRSPRRASGAAPRCSVVGLPSSEGTSLSTISVLYSRTMASSDCSDRKAWASGFSLEGGASG